MDTLQVVIRDFSEVFSEDLGAYNGQPVLFTLNPTVALIQMKPHYVAFIFHPKTDAKIDLLVEQVCLRSKFKSNMGHPHCTYHETKW